MKKINPLPILGLLLAAEVQFRKGTIHEKFPNNKLEDLTDPAEIEKELDRLEKECDCDESLNGGPLDNNNDPEDPIK